MNNQDFFNLLFDPGEHTCFAKFAGGTKVYPITAHNDVLPWVQFFSINPIHPTKDLNPTEDYHSEDKPRRCDKNVTVYRNILIEMDTIPLKDQVALVQNMGLPYSTATYSGGKSIHWIISLVHPVSDEKAYRKLVERVQKALGGKAVVDQANKNPSRFSRFPGAIRVDKDNAVQKLFKVKSRVDNDVLEAWLLSKGVKEVEPIKPNRPIGGYDNLHNVEYNNQINKNRHMNGFTLNFVMFGAPEGERNLSLFKAACDMFKCGYDEDEVYDRLKTPSGLDRHEVKQTIKSALRRVEADQE